MLVYRNDTPDVVGSRFVRGDANADGEYSIADAVKTLSVLFAAAGPFSCDDAADANNDGALDIADAIFTLSAPFASGPRPSAPYPDCGADPHEGALGCDAFAPCQL